jgi:hypothetical protein
VQQFVHLEIPVLKAIPDDEKLLCIGVRAIAEVRVEVFGKPEQAA